MTTDIAPRHVGVGTFTVTELMRKNIDRVLNSGRISYGPMSLEFEQEFARVHGCEYAILSNSGTSALQIALQAMKEAYQWKDGDEVIVPATTFVATANIVIHNRMKPVFVDIDTGDYGINVHQISRAITDKTRAIIPVHLFGQPCNMKRVNQIASENDLLVIEDSCETMFAYHHDQPVGSLGDIGCFSTYVAHLLVTGVGGICTTNNALFAGRMRSLVNHGLALKFLNPGKNFSPNPAVGRRFRFESVGHSYRITEMEAALGLAQLAGGFRANMLRIRKRNANHYNVGLKILNEAYNVIHIPKVMPGNTHSWMMYPILLKRGMDKEPLMEYLNEQQIETRDMMPILKQPYYHYLKPDDFPNSRWVLESGFYVGCHQDLVPDDIQYVLQEIGNYLDKLYKNNAQLV